MRKLLRVSDWFLLGLAGVLDFLEEIRDPMGLIENYYQNFYGFVPTRYRKNQSYQFIWRNLKTGNITKKAVKGKVYFEITSSAKEKIKRRFPILMIKKPTWDKIFRVVIYDIEEENRKIRDLFRKKVKELGFGMVQKSVWVTPYDFLKDFQEFLQSYNLEEKVILMETRNFYIGDLKEFAQKAWSIKKINDQYKEIYNDLLNFASLKRKHDRYQILNNLRKKIVTLYLHDPFLPDEFLPVDWYGKEVIKLVRKLKIFE